MKRFHDKNILVAITGGIAAYKACDFIRLLIREEARQVQAVMTPAAESFITPLTLESLTRQPVYTENLENTLDGIPTHVAMAQIMDMMVILPASANTLAKLAQGMADNLVTTTALTFTGKPLVVVPAMNTRMWENPTVQRNVSWLQALENVTVVPPVDGLLACGETGPGKLSDLETILMYCERALHPHRGLYRGKRVVVTAGGTREPVDAVRVLTNRSSGKMGLAIADTLFAMGADVHLIHTLEGVDKPYVTHRVETVEGMRLACKQAFQNADGLIMAAAVSDFCLPDAARTEGLRKLKKTESLTLHLAQTPDILTELASTRKSSQFVVGFAAESDDHLPHAEAKLREKHLDAIVLNDISRPDIGFGSPNNEVTLLFQDGEQIRLPYADKRIIAGQLLFCLAHKHFYPAPDAGAEPHEALHRGLLSSRQTVVFSQT